MDFELVTILSPSVNNYGRLFVYKHLYCFTNTFSFNEKQ